MMTQSIRSIRLLFPAQQLFWKQFKIRLKSCGHRSSARRARILEVVVVLVAATKVTASVSTVDKKAIFRESALHKR